jgi:hypothetical protein
VRLEKLLKWKCCVFEVLMRLEKFVEVEMLL